MKKPEPKYTPTRTFSVDADGFYGLYYEPKINNFPGKAMVICTGSDGSFLLCRLGADWFVDAGMPVIALGYFNCPGTPDDPLECPVEYMLRAVRWLREEKGMHVGVWGISLGGEYSLLCGSMFPEIECVVASSPVHIVTQCGSFNGGLHFCMGSPFSYEGKAIPCLMPAPTEHIAKQFVHRMYRSFLKQREPDMLFFYTETLGKPHSKEADIPVENINGPVLLISGAQDVMVPSNWNCEQTLQRIKAHDPEHVAVHNNYEYMSHYACPLRPMTSSLFKVERKYKKECSESRAQMWKDTLDFLKNEWAIKD